MTAIEAFVIYAASGVVPLVAFLHAIEARAMGKEKDQIEYRLRCRHDGWWVEVKAPHLTTRKGGWMSCEGPIIDHAEAVRVFDKHRGAPFKGE